MRIHSILPAIVFALITLTGGSEVYASFHMMQIEQVIGGVDGDTSAQAIQLRMRTSGQNLVSFTRLIVRDAAGLNPVIVKDMTSNVTNLAAGARILIASPSFSSHTSPAASPDFVMTSPIPTGYLAAGRLTFEDDFGTIYWSLSWGDTNYTGSNTGSTVNDADGNFGPAFSGPLPSSNLSALQFTGPASALSTANLADYAMTAGSAVFVNNAGTAFTVLNVVVPPTISISRETNDIRVTWMTIAGKTNSLQRTTGTVDGAYSTNFTDIFTVTNSIGSITNYLDVGAVTNFQSSYYRVFVLP